MQRRGTAALVCQHGTAPERCSICQPARSQTYKAVAETMDDILAASRPRLLRVARLNGIAADEAEDVVQETCLAAWRHLDQVREPERFGAWLDGICRNLCKSYLRTQATSSQTNTWPMSEDEAGASAFDLADPLAIDPVTELERQDLQALLDRALGHLSESTRTLIELCYLAELPQREIAEQLEMSLGALELKLHRARRHLRQVLSGEMRGEAEAFGLLVNPDETMGWRETRQWCFLCGKHRLRGTFECRPSGVVALRLRCPDCSVRYGLDLSGSGEIISLAGLRSFRPAMKRAVRASCAYFANAVHHRTCGMCQSPVRIWVGNRHIPGEAPLPYPLFPQRSALGVECPQCGCYLTDLANLWLLEPAASTFALDRPRVIWEPDILVSYAGQDAICSRLVDLSTAEQLTIMAHPETLQVMALFLA